MDPATEAGRRIRPAEEVQFAQARKLPPWLRRPRTANASSGTVATLVRDLSLRTVCEDARCPNLSECWSAGTATFMILGSQCTRRCGFCAIDTGRPAAPDAAEPEHLANAAAHLKLEHVVITSVARDDLADQGASHFAQSIRAVRAKLPKAGVEVLTPDFRGNELCLSTVLEAGPDVFNHNLETVERLSPAVRPQARYRRSLDVLRTARRIFASTPATAGRGAAFVKSGMMLGLGETEVEIKAALTDLADAGCQLLTLGQYLRPTPAHLPVERYVAPAEFDRWSGHAASLGFLHIAASPFTRSSHHAAEGLTAARAAVA